jgi:hypothetical protein
LAGRDKKSVDFFDMKFVNQACASYFGKNVGNAEFRFFGEHFAYDYSRISTFSFAEYFKINGLVAHKEV